MNKTAAVLGLVAGIFGLIAAVITLVFGGAASAFGAKGASTVVYLGWGGVFFSFATIVFGALAFSKPRVAGWGLTVCAILGAALGGTLVAICMLLALVAGVLAFMSSPARPKNTLVVSEGAGTVSGKLGIKTWQRVALWSVGGLAGLLVLLLAASQSSKSGSETEVSQTQTQAENSPLAALAAAPTSDLKPTGQLAELFQLGTKSTAVQRENAEKSIQGKVVVWQLRVYEVKREDDGYVVTTTDSISSLLDGEPVVATSISLTPRNAAERVVIEAFKTGDNIRFKGYIKDVSLRRIRIKPAMLWPQKQAAPVAAQNSSENPQGSPVQPDHKTLKNRYILECTVGVKQNAIRLGGMAEGDAEELAKATCMQSGIKFGECVVRDGATYEACSRLSNVSAE